MKTLLKFLKYRVHFLLTIYTNESYDINLILTISPRILVKIRSVLVKIE